MNIGSRVLLQGVLGEAPHTEMALLCPPHLSHQLSATHTCCDLSSPISHVTAPVDP